MIANSMQFLGVWVESILLIIYLIVDYWQLPTLIGTVTLQSIDSIINSLLSLLGRKNAFLKGLELIEDKKDFIQNIGRHQVTTLRCNELYLMDFDSNTHCKAEWIIKDEDIKLGECIGSGGTAAVFKGSAP